MTCSLQGIPGKIPEVFVSLIASVMPEPAGNKIRNEKRTEAPVLSFPKARFVQSLQYFFRIAKTGNFAGYGDRVSSGCKTGMG